MHCTLSAKQQESLVRQITMYAQQMAEQLVAQVRELGSEAPPPLAEMEKAVLAALHRLGNETLCTLLHSWVPAYPPARIACRCGGEAHY
jgi:hypothetical protein